MNGLLFYKRNDYERNSWFANQIILEAKFQGITIELIIIDDCDLVIDNDELFILYKNKKIITADFAIVRSILPKFTMFIEKMGIRCFNSSNVSIMCNDKFLTYTLANENRIKTIPTIYSDYCSLPRKACMAFSSFMTDEIIIKSTDGHGGSEVFLISKSEIKDELENTHIKEIIPESMNNKHFCVQPRIKGISKDLRVYVLGNKTYACMLRSSKDSFKANFCLGGKCEEYILNEKQKAIVKKVIDLLKADFVGIDFIVDENDNLIFNEIEDVVGTRMLYSTTKYNPVHDYINYILNTLDKKLQN